HAPAPRHAGGRAAVPRRRAFCRSLRTCRRPASAEVCELRSRCDRGDYGVVPSLGGSWMKEPRIELERQFGAEYGAWAEQVGEMRQKLRRRNLPAAERRKLLDQIASEDSFEQLLRDRGSRKR